MGRATALANPGDYVTLELAGQPIMVIRDREGTLRAQSNVCLHRMSILLKGAGNVKGIVCPYHGWSYNTDGSLRAAPAMKHNEGFCKEDYRLPQIAARNGWLVDDTLNPEAFHQRKTRRRGGLIATTMENYIENFMSSSSGIPTGKFWPRISWRATTSPSAMPKPLADCQSSMK